MLGWQPARGCQGLHARAQSQANCSCLEPTSEPGKTPNSLPFATRAAGLPTVGVCCEVMHPDGHMAGAAELERFALHWGLPLIDIGDLANHL
ncbi:MAG: 3,4-dihydroxy-2-butanone-4-phosphate synthase [Myxococcota bacterium]